MAPPNTTPAPTLARALGLSTEQLKKIRAGLTPDTDWLAGQPILYTAEGVKKIRALLRLPEPPPDPDPPSVNPWTTAAACSPASASAGTEQPQGPVRETLKVLRAARGNRLIVLCTAPDGRPVNLRVKDNAHFIPGMDVPNCVQRPSAPRQYDFEGRLPRRKGRFK